MDPAADQCTYVAQQDVAILQPAYVPPAKQVRRLGPAGMSGAVCRAYTGLESARTA